MVALALKEFFSKNAVLSVFSVVKKE